MLPELENLLVVQDRDRKIKNLERDLAQIPAKIEHAKTRLTDDRMAVEKCKAEIQANEVSMKRLELDIETRQDSISKLRRQQYETKKNEEYRAMGTEIERYQRDIKKLEDEELEFMEVAEGLKEKLAACQESLAKTQAIVDDELAQLKERKKNATSQIDELRAEREQFATKIDPSLLSIYDRLFTNKRDFAVVPLENGQCKGCHMRVTSSTAIKVKGEKEVTHCEQCGRILYLNE